MAAGYKFLINTGVIVADTQDLLTDVQAEWVAAFGTTLDLDASTPQGTMITAEVIARAAVMRNNAELANQINPNEAFGVFLDAIASLLGVDRGSNQSTVGRGLKVTGNENTFIPAGSRVQTGSGDIFFTVADLTIPNGGVTEMGSIISQAFGSIELPVGQLRIVDGVIGWGSIEVLVTTTVTPGTMAVNDPKLKNLRNQRLAAQGIGSSSAIRAAILKVNNVTSCQVMENNTGIVQAINGVTFSKPNAMWVCIAGTPDIDELAYAVYSAHHGGCPWDFGVNSGVPIEGPIGVQIIDKTTKQPYQVLMTRPVSYDVYVHVIVTQSTSVSDPEPSIRAAIMQYANGQLAGEEGLVVGASISSWEVSGAISRELPGMYVKELKVAVVAKGAVAPIYPAGFVYEFPMKPFEQGVIDFGRIQVVAS